MKPREGESREGFAARLQARLGEPTPETPVSAFGRAGAEAQVAFTTVVLAAHRAAELYAAHSALGLLLDLGLEPRLREGADLETLLAGFAPQSRLPLHWMLELLVDEDLLRHEGERYRLDWAGEPELTAIREASEALAPGQGVNLDLLDAVRRQIPPFFTQGKAGEGLLFDLALLPLWSAYFHNDNAVYRPNNLLPLLALEDGLPEGGRVLEVGSGAGSFVRLLHARWQAAGRLDRLATYHFTDVAPMFLRRAQRELGAALPGLPLAIHPFDLNAPAPSAQVPEGGFDAIVGVNVLHVAKDLGVTLRGLRSLLAPGGRLIVAEALKPDLGHPIYLEFFFNFLHAFTDVDLHPEWRPCHGFLTPECWTAAFLAAGFSAVEEYPPSRGLMSLNPAFNVGAFAARA